MPNRITRCLLTLPMLLALAGCIGGTTPPSQFYLLEPLKNLEESQPGAAGRFSIALAPVRIPQYVDRPQIVTATAKNAYHLSELNRWAERLDDNIARVLAQNLSLLVPTDRVTLNASGQNPPTSLRVSVNILQFHVDAQGQAGLTTQWTVAKGGETLLARQASYHEAASTSDYRAMAGALNECLNRLSRDIAEALRTLAE